MTKDEQQLACIGSIRSGARSLSEKTITLGFDGFIDSVVKLIKHKDQHRRTSYFESTEEFGEYTVQKGQKNFSLELEELTTKLGGNMPIMANALGVLGPKVSCIGSLGHPVIHPVFRNMSSNCHLISFADPGISKVIEFKRGKMMLAEMGALNRIEWKFIKDTIGDDVFYNLFTHSDLIALLNWSELDNSTEVWKGLLRDILPRSAPSKRPVGFFDLSDCSKRTDASICEAMDLIKSFSAYWDVVLSLNLNEATIVHSALMKRKRSEENVEKMCEEIFSMLSINTVVIHYAKQSVAWNSEGGHKKKSFFIKEPVISSGSGDNFNAGLCIGRLMDLDIGNSLTLGHATSSLYMRSARSPTLDEVLAFLSSNLPTVGIPSQTVAR